MKQIFTSLKLAYSPVSNYDFYFLKKENIIQQILDDATIYMICQREELTFENITYDDEFAELKFEIHKKGNSNILECSLPIYQKNIEPNEDKEIEVEFGNHKDKLTSNAMPLFDIKGMKFYSVENSLFLFWLTPDKFLHNYWNKLITANIKGNYREFTKFKVHYVGEATEQKIWKRLTGHEKIQDILTLEKPFNYKSLNTHEITLLLFKIENVENMNIFNGSNDIDNFIEEWTKPKIPSRKTITKDIEKALINILKPSKKYNKKQYDNYPKSKDGLYKSNYNGIFYKIRENITLEYEEVEIQGNTNDLKSSTIVIENNKTIILKQ